MSHALSQVLKVVPLLAVGLSASAFDFAEPPRECRPGVWFHLIGGNVSRPGLTADLEAIRAAGLSSITLFHEQVGGEVPWPGVPEPIPCLSPKWKDLVGFLGDECERLGVDFRMQNCPGWSTSGGPWIAASNAMRIVVHSRKDVKGGGPIGELPLPPEANDNPERDYRDIAVVAFPTPKWDDGTELKPVAVTTNDWTFIYDFGRPVEIRSLVFSPPANYSREHAFDTGVRFAFFAEDPDRESAVVQVPRTTWMDDSTLTVACPPLRSRRWRLTVEHPHPMETFSVRFLSAQRLENWEGASGMGMRGVMRRQYPQQPSEGWIAEGSVRVLTGRADETLPPGRWTVLRVGHVNELRFNHPAPKVGTGWECTKLDRSGIEAHFAGFAGDLMKGPLADGKLKGLLIDSWECMRQTWGNCLEEEFAKRSSFDLRTWMPALFGYVIGNPDKTREFLRDWTGVRGWLVEENYYRRFAELCHEHGLEAFYETAFGDVVAGDLMRYWKWSDAPMCEYWQPHTGNFVGGFEFKPVMPCVSAAHLYGKRRVAAEALTSFGLTFDENFRLFKRVMDMHFARGVTYNIFQAYTHKPEVGGKGPGSSFGAPIGTPFLREQTWWPYMKELVDYSARCTALLEKGRPVVDILRYLGDDFDHRPREPETLKGIDAQYKTDYLNGDVLEERLSVRGGRFVLPDGMSYSVLWLPDDVFVTEEHRQRIAELERQGGKVICGDLAAGLRRHAVWADVSIDNRSEGKLDWYHRREGNRDIWFVAASTNGFSDKVSFRVEDVGRHVLSLELEPAQSLFVVREGESWTLLDPTTGKAREEPPTDGAPKVLEKWQVDFPTRMLTNVTLTAWKDLPGSDADKAFSGTASYRCTFEAKADVRLTLDLGRVRDFAEVFVNGKSVRRLWCEPYRCSLEGFLVPGRNELRVDVTSTWFNRLAADAAKPEAERTTWTLFGPEAGSPLRESGLVGPVRLYEDRLLAAKPVWVRGKVGELNGAYGFAAAFDAKKGTCPVLKLAAASIARIWVNGRFAGYGPARAAEGFARVDEWPLGDFLEDGRNVIAIEVSSPRVNQFYLPDRDPFLAAEVVLDGRILAATGRDFKAIDLPRVRKVNRFSFQRGYAEFLRLKPDSDKWRLKGVTGDGLPQEERPLPKLLPREAPYPDFAFDGTFRPSVRTTFRRDPVKPVKEVIALEAAGIGRYKGFRTENLEVNMLEKVGTLVATPQGAAAYPVRLAAGEGVCFTNAAETAGFPCLTVTCGKPATLWLLMDEYAGLDGLPDPLRFYGCVNACGWRLEEPGDYRLECFEPNAFGAAHLVVDEGEVTVKGFDVRTYGHPGLGRAKFRSSDPAFDRLFDAAKRSLQWNAVDCFTDCPGRERGIYVGDTVFTARGALALLGETEMERVQFMNYAMASAFRDVPEGMMPMCYPADETLTGPCWIPNFCLWAVIQLDDYVRRSGDRATAAAMRGKAEAMLAWFRRSRNADGLLENLPGWVFVEWSDASKYVDGVSYLTNMTYAKFLDAMAELYGLGDCRAEAESVRETVRRQSWDGTWFRDHAVRDAQGGLDVRPEHSEAAQCYAFYTGIATKETHADLWRRFTEDLGPLRKPGVWPKVCPSNLLFGYALRLVSLSEEGQSKRVLDELRHCYVPMAEKTGTLWEAVNPEDGYSTCHGFPSMSAWLLFRDALGVRRIDRKTKTVKVAAPAVPLDWCEGVVPLSETEAARVSWRRDSTGTPKLSVELPGGWRRE